MNSVSKIMMALAAAGLTAGAAGTAHALATYGDLATPPGYYAGNGPANGEFTIDTSSGIEVALRAKDRTTGALIDGSSGVYLVNRGYCTPGTGICGGVLGGVPNKAAWNYEFSVNSLNGSLGSDLSNYRVELRIDTDPSSGVSFTTILDAYTNWGDNEYVDGPAYGGKRIGGLPAAGEDGVQQSSNPLFANSGFQPGFNPFAPGLYEIEISVFAAGVGGAELASTDITVQVVPEPASALLLGIGLAGLGFAARRRKAA